MATNLIRYDFEMREREQLDIKIVMPRDERSVVHGVVYDKCGRLVKDAVVKLFEVGHKDHCEKDGKIQKRYEMKPVTHAFTDDYGQFLFGPLCPKKKYSIKVWYSAICCRCDVFYGKVDTDCLKPCCREEEKKRGCECECEEDHSHRDICAPCIHED